MTEDNKEVVKGRRGRKRNVEAWKRKQLWAVRMLQKGPLASSYQRASRRKARYSKVGQYKEGQFYCKSGRPITWKRVEGYVAMCHHMVRRFLPAKALYEASYGYDDLVNQCLREVFLALLDGFDPDKAMTSTIKDPVLRAIKEVEKKANPEKTLADAEFSIVYGRLENYMRRTIWRHHPDQTGGRTSSYDAILQGINQEFSNGFYADPLVSQSVQLDRERLLEILEIEGAEKAREAFLALDDDKRDSLLELLRSEGNNPWLNVAPMTEEPGEEKPEPVETEEAEL